MFLIQQVIDLPTKNFDWQNMLKELLEFSSARHNLISETINDCIKHMKQVLKQDFKSEFKVFNQIKFFQGNWQLRGIWHICRRRLPPVPPCTHYPWQLSRSRRDGGAPSVVSRRKGNVGRVTSAGARAIGVREAPVNTTSATLARADTCLSRMLKGQCWERFLEERFPGLTDQVGFDDGSSHVLLAPLLQGDQKQL